MLHSLNLLIVAVYSFFSAYFEKFNYMLMEDHIVEYSGAIMLFIATFMICFYTAKNWHVLGKIVRFLLLGYCCFMFVAAGEEISWGQRLIGLETPETIAKYNMQGEFNLHNLEVFNRRDRDGDKTGLSLLLSAEMMYNLIALFMFLLLPLIRNYMGKFKPLCPTVHFIAPVLLSFILMKFFLSHYGNIQTDLMSLERGLGEIKESLLSILFATHGLVLAFQLKKNSL